MAEGTRALKRTEAVAALRKVAHLGGSIAELRMHDPTLDGHDEQQCARLGGACVVEVKK